MSDSAAPASAGRAWREDEKAVLLAVTGIARRHLGWEGELSRDQSLADSLGLDSVRFLTLVVELEDHFRICFGEDDEAGVATVGDLVDLVRRKCAESGADAR